MSQERFTVKLEEKKELTHNVVELHFSKPDTLDFTAGQFMQFFIPDEEKGEVKRSYSLCTSPKEAHLGFCIKLLEGGKASHYFSHMKIGDEAQIAGPKGRFCCTPNPTPLYFIATGSGIAPIMGLITDELRHKKNTEEIRLLFGVRNEADMFWRDEFDALTREYPNFSYSFILSRPGEGWDGLEGYVTHHIEEHTTNHSYYLCGRAEMVKDVRSLLIERGVDAKHIHFEIF